MVAEPLTISCSHPFRFSERLLANNPCVVTDNFSAIGTVAPKAFLKRVCTPSMAAVVTSAAFPEAAWAEPATEDAASTTTRETVLEPSATAEDALSTTPAETPFTCSAAKLVASFSLLETERRSPMRKSSRLSWLGPSTFQRLWNRTALWVESSDSMAAGRRRRNARASSGSPVSAATFVKLGVHGVLRGRQHAQIEDRAALPVQENDRPKSRLVTTGTLSAATQAVLVGP